MALFVSYSSQDRAAVDGLATALRRAQQQVWFDQELGGGDSWWAKILEQIRACDLFVVALSSNWLQSKPSQSELRYAQALNRPVLPVRIGDIGSMRVNPLAALQIIDYRNPTVDAGIQLVTAVHSLTSKPQPLPDPLPDEPPVPFGYITRLGNMLAEKELSPQQQLQLLVELRSGLDEDGDDPSARSDIAQLLRMMRLRHDVTYRTRNDIDNVLASIESGEPGPSPGPAAAGAAAQTAPTAQPDAAVSAAAGGGAATTGGPNRRLLIIGGAAVAVVVAIVLAVVFMGQGSSPKKAPAGARNAPAPAAPAPATGAPAEAAPAPGANARLDSVLLGAPQVAAIVGAPRLDIVNQTEQIRQDVNLSNPACLGSFDAIQNSVYAGSEYTGVRGQELNTQDGAYRIYEAAVSFRTAEKARAFVAAQTDKWRTCNGLPVALTTSGGTGHWIFGDLGGAAPKITQVRTRKDKASTCERVLSAVSDVVLDVRACGPDAANHGGQIAEAMAANVR